jgi:Helix-turn-helix domain/RodZ C-terminal domain
VFEIGNSLREARYRQQLELTEIEQATKIRARYLRALEEESFDVLPAPTYVKGFLRTYADYLGLDGQLYVDEYNSRYGVGEEEPREPVVARRSVAQQRHHRLERRGVLLALAGIGALFALVIAAWKFSGNNKQAIPPNLPTTTAKPTKPPAPAHRRPARPRRIRFFILAASGPSWMEIRNYSVSGRALFTGTLDFHEHLFFRARRLWIDIGRPASLKASVNGKAITFPGGGRAVTVLVGRNGATVAPTHA